MNLTNASAVCRPLDGVQPFKCSREEMKALARLNDDVAAVLGTDWDVSVRRKSGYLAIVYSKGPFAVSPSISSSTGLLEYPEKERVMWRAKRMASYSGDDQAIEGAFKYTIGDAFTDLAACISALEDDLKAVRKDVIKYAKACTKAEMQVDA